MDITTNIEAIKVLKKLTRKPKTKLFLVDIINKTSYRAQIRIYGREQIKKLNYFDNVNDAHICWYKNQKEQVLEFAEYFLKQYLISKSEFEYYVNLDFSIVNS